MRIPTATCIPFLLTLEERLAQQSLSVGKMGYTYVNQPVRRQMGAAWQQVPQRHRQQVGVVRQKMADSVRMVVEKWLVLPYNWLKKQAKSLALRLYHFSPEGLKKPLETTAKKVHTFFVSLKTDVETEKIALDALKAYLDAPATTSPKRTELVMLGKKIADYKRLCDLSFWGCLLPIPLTYLAELGALMPQAVFLNSPLNNPLMNPLVEQTRKNFWGTVILGEVLENIVPFVTIPFRLRRKHLSQAVKTLVASQAEAKTLGATALKAVNPPLMGVGGLLNSSVKGKPPPWANLNLPSVLSSGYASFLVNLPGKALPSIGLLPTSTSETVQ